MGMKESSVARKKREAVARARAALRVTLGVSRGPWCEACPKTPVGTTPPRPWGQMHEVLTRGRGGSPTDPENILCVCEPCHSWITTHETDARAAGLVRNNTGLEHRAKYRPWE